MIVKQEGYQEYIPNKTVIDVSGLNHKVNTLIEHSDLQNIWVKGEVSNLQIRETTSFFTLKDEESCIDCVCFDKAILDEHVIEEGDEVKVHGDVSYYRKKGVVNVEVDRVKIVGDGLLHKKFLKLKKELDEKGFFKKADKQAIPKPVETIGVLTSKDGAAIEDFLTTVKRRYPHLSIKVWDSKVQGENAPSQLIHGLNKLDSRADVIAMIRGGGSLEDLWCFNDKNLLKNMKNVSTPILTGIGHEKDETLADLVADRKTGTPTSAAEYLTPNEEECITTLSFIQERLTKEMISTIEDVENRVEEVEKKIDTCIVESFSKIERELEVLDLKIENNNYRKLLEKGFGIIKKEGDLINTVNDVSEKDILTLHVSDGKINTRVIR